MKLGVNLVNFGPGAGPETLARTAQLAEALGYHLVMISDHVAITPDVAARFGAPFASYDGPFVSFKDVQTAPRPLRAPHPPIWVGGSSDGALRRAVRFGDAWHPIRVRVDSLAATGLPRLREIAAAEGRRVPALCPRIRLKLTETPVPEDGRLAGQGTLDQMRRDLEALAALGAAYVLLDPYDDAPEATRDLAPVWRALETLAAKVLDLGREAVR